MTAIEDAVNRIKETDDLLIQVDGDFDIRDLIFLLNEGHYHAIIIDRAPVTNRETLMHALYQSLRFPGYFGFTWDSLKDILTGIEGVPGKSFIFAFSDLSLLDEDSRREFLEVIEDANEIRECGDELGRIQVMALKT
jgi:RNAse (barnase) inhibitor barstar